MAILLAWQIIGSFFGGIRVSESEEIEGLDIGEHGMAVLSVAYLIEFLRTASELSFPGSIHHASVTTPCKGIIFGMPNLSQRAIRS